MRKFSMQVLIVEDDKILSDTIKQCIKSKYSVEQAYDGQEGVLFATQDIYDVIILVLMMPIMNGYEVLAELRKKHIYTPVLILTAKDALEDKVRGFNIGADDYLVKPFEKEELIARIDAMIRRNNRTYIKNELIFENMKLDLSSRKAYIENKEINTSRKTI